MTASSSIDNAIEMLLKRPVLPQFRDIERHFRESHQRMDWRIKPGEYYVSCDDETITTVLGSCISVCMRDPALGIGGMNHFLLPASTGDTAGRSPLTRAARYGNFAMEHLVNDIMRFGGIRKRLEVKFFGGARMGRDAADIGSRNIEFVRDYFATEGLNVVAQDVGGATPRRVVYFPRSGRTLMKRLPPVHAKDISVRERAYEKVLRKKRRGGDIELF